MASDSDTGPAVSPQAKAWIDALCSGRGACGAWRLELLDQRSRRLPESSDSDAPRMKLLPMRIRRSVPGLPRSLVDSAVRYLVSLAPYSGIVYEGEEIPGEWWPARTAWRMDQGMNGRDGTYTLVQDLVPSQADALEGVAAADSCSSVATTDWHWEELDVEDVSGRSSQGVTVAVQAVSRNEDGTLDYSVVTRTALTQDSGWYVSKCDAFSRVERRAWDNVYGTPSAPAQSGGEPFPEGDAPPEPCSSRDPETGVTFEVQWRENEDCTWRVEAERTFPVLDISDAQEGRRRSLGGVTSTVVARNLSREEAKALVERLLAGSDSEIGIGDSYEIRLNEFGLYDVEASDTRAARAGTIGTSATRNAFRREAERRENVDRAAASAELGIDPSKPGTQTLVSQPRAGVVRAVEARVTDTGTVDVTTRWTYDTSDGEAQVGRRRTLNGVTTTTLARNLAHEAALALVNRLRGADGEIGIGDSYELRKTDSGLYDVERVDTSAAEIGAVAASATANAFRREAETRTNVDRPDAEDILGLELSDGEYAFVEPTAPGRVRTVEARVTETGTVDITRRAVYDISDGEAQVGRRRTLNGVTTTTLARNLAHEAALALVEQLKGSDGEIGIGDAYELRKTDSGLYDVERVDTRAAEIGATGASATANAFRREAEVRTNVDRSDAEDILGIGLSDGQYVFVEPTAPGRVRTIEARVTETGTVDVTRRVARDIADLEAQYGARRTLTSVTTSTLARNLPKATADQLVLALAGQSDAGLDVGESYEVRKTDSGLYDVERVRHDVAVPDGLTAWEVSSTPIVVRASATRHVSNGSAPTPTAWAADQSPGAGMSVVSPGGKGGWWMDRTSGEFHVSWAGRGRRVSETAVRNEDGSWRQEISEEVEKEESDAYFSQVLLSPLSIVYLRWYARVSRGTLKTKVAALEAELDKFKYNAASMGHSPTSMSPSLEVSEDQYGLLNAKLALAVQWPAGSYGTEGWQVSSDGTTVNATGLFGPDGEWLGGSEDTAPYFVIRFADTMLGAGRGQATLMAFMQRQYEDPDSSDAYGRTVLVGQGRARGKVEALGFGGLTRGTKFDSWLDGYAKTMQAASDILAAMIGVTTSLTAVSAKQYDPFTKQWHTVSAASAAGARVTIPIENIRAGIMYSVDRVNASLDPSTGHWTASYTFANMSDRMGRIRDMLLSIIDEYVGLAQSESVRLLLNYLTDMSDADRDKLLKGTHRLVLVRGSGQPSYQLALVPTDESSD